MLEVGRRIDAGQIGAGEIVVGGVAAFVVVVEDASAVAFHRSCSRDFAGTAPM